MVALPLENTVHDDLAQKSYALVSASSMTPLQDYPAEWLTLAAEYAHLPADEFLPGAARYRFRRNDRFQYEPLTGSLQLLPHEADTHGMDGVARNFAPLTPETTTNPFLHALIRWDFAQFPIRNSAWRYGSWEVDVHLVHIIANPGETAQPTPEGIHRDGAEFAAVHLALLDNADGGFVTVYDSTKEPLECFRLHRIMDAYFLDDAALWHSVTPIRPHDELSPAARGILTFDYHFIG